MEQGAPKFVSRVTLAEIKFGILLDEAATEQKHPRAQAVLAAAEQYKIREITKHTADEYAELRTRLAVTYLSSFIRSIARAGLASGRTG